MIAVLVGIALIAGSAVLIYSRCYRRIDQVIKGEIESFRQFMKDREGDQQ